MVSSFKCEGKNSCHDLIPDPRIWKEGISAPESVASLSDPLGSAFVLLPPQNCTAPGWDRTATIKHYVITMRRHKSTLPRKRAANSCTRQIPFLVIQKARLRSHIQPEGLCTFSSSYERFLEIWANILSRYEYSLTNSMAYETRRFNAAFKRALQ